MAQKRLTPDVLASIKIDREEHGCTITTIMAKHGISRGTAFVAIRNMDSSRVRRAAPSRKVVQPVTRPARPPLSKADLGEAARQMVITRMMLAGLKVFRPLTEDTPVDILVLRDDGVALKCQVKCFVFNKAGHHTMNLTSTRKWGPNAKTVQHRYTKQEVDFFIGYVVETESIYVFPFNAVAHLRTVLSAWILREPMGRNGAQPLDIMPFHDAFHLMSP